MAVLKADPQYRRKVLLCCFMIAVLGLGAALCGLPALENRIRGMALADAIHLLQTFVAVLFVPLLPAAYCTYRFARKIQTSGQFPPPGAKVIRDTEILEGGPARRKTSYLITFSVVLAITAMVGTIYLPYLIGKIGEQIERQNELRSGSSNPFRPGLDPMAMALG
jgi:hypothetical protein